MKLLTTTGTFRKQFEVRYPVYRSTVSGLITRIANFADGHGWALFGVISVWCGWMRLTGQLNRHLGHDELYTFYIAQAPSISKLLTLPRTIDLHPPLSYLFVRLSFALFGVSAWSCRLPSAVAFVLTTLLIYCLLQHTLSPLYGLIAVLFLWSFPYAYNASIARPYSLLLCFATIMVVSWYRAGESVGDRTFALFGICFEDERIAKRLFLLTNKEAASTIAHDTLFENYAQLKAVFPIRGDLEPYCSFLSGHRRFLVLGKYQHPQGWLLPKLDKDGAQLRIGN